MSNLLENDDLVSGLRHAMRDSSSNLGVMPGLLRRVLNEDAWRERTVKRTGEIVSFSSFEEFVATPPLEGLGGDMRLLRNLVRDHNDVLDLIDRAVQKPAHVHRDSDNITVTPDPNDRGTSAAGALRRLRKDRPDLHARVLAGELSPHAAMIEAGFRPRTITVPLDPHRAARTLLRHFDLAELLEALAQADRPAP